MMGNREWNEPQRLDRLPAYLLHWREALTEWEISFLTNLAYTPSPSIKQTRLLCGIRDRVSKLAMTEVPQ